MKKRLFVLLLLISPFSYAETNRTAASIDCNDRANEIRMSDQLDEAISVLGDCLSEELNRVARTYLLLGLSYYGQDEQNKAIANYSKAIEFAPAYVTAYTNRTRINNSAQAENSNFCRTTTNINDHRTGGLRHRKTGADGCRHGLFNQEDTTRACAFSRFLNSAAFNGSGAGGYADNDQRACEAAPVHCQSHSPLFHNDG